MCTSETTDFILGTQRFVFVLFFGPHPGLLLAGLGGPDVVLGLKPGWATGEARVFPAPASGTEHFPLREWSD